MSGELWSAKRVPLETLKKRQLERMRDYFASRIGGIESFVSWPALIESLRGTLDSIEAEIARREAA